jgi:guanine deaminase
MNPPPEFPAAFRASILHFVADPGADDAPHSWRFFDDGLLIVEHGKVKSVGHARDLLPELPDNAHVVDHSGRLILPGFVDSHIHYPQTDAIASPGGQLLEWLSDYTFPAERRFNDPEYAREVADFFLDELLRNGTTTALVLGTVHKESVDAFFQAAEAKSLRMIAGKVLMDRNCPDYLRDTAESGYRDSTGLIAKWNGRDRLNYAITPRFAATSSDRQLALAGQLAREHPTARIHSHLAENLAEVAWVRELFPSRRSYLDVYDHYGLLREHAVFAHCIHLDDDDRRRMAETRAAAAFCPTSNLFLGSGLFDIAAADRTGMRFGIATDVGGGTSFSMLRTLSEAYKVAKMRGQFLSPLRALYLATLGGARVLGVDEQVGNLEPGMEADFVVLDMASTPLAARRTEHAKTLSERLFALIMLGDDRAVTQTYVLGRPMLAPG